MGLLLLCEELGSVDVEGLVSDVEVDDLFRFGRASFDGSCSLFRFSTFLASSSEPLSIT